MKSKFAKKKDEGGKKAEQKKKAQKIADATFGLKNKNKSAKVQKFVQATEKSIHNGGDQKSRQAADKLKMAKANKRAAKKGTQNKLLLWRSLFPLGSPSAASPTQTQAA
jgi:hypothetical protein